jgi:hypothetical protein
MAANFLDDDVHTSHVSLHPGRVGIDGDGLLSAMVAMGGHLSGQEGGDESEGNSGRAHCLRRSV